MDNKFTRQAQNALKLAKNTAKSSGHGYIGTEHLLVGLLKEQEGTAGKVLQEFEVEEDRLMKLISELITLPQGENLTKETEILKYSPRSERILNQAHTDAENGMQYRYRAHSAGFIKRDRLCGNQTSVYYGNKHSETFCCCAQCHGI